MFFEGKNIYNYLNNVYRPQGHQEYDLYGLQLCFCFRALCVGAFNIAPLYDPSFCKTRVSERIATP